MNSLLSPVVFHLRDVSQVSFKVVIARMPKEATLWLLKQK